MLKAVDMILMVEHGGTWWNMEETLSFGCEYFESIFGCRWKPADLRVKSRAFLLHPKVSIHIIPNNLNQKPSGRNLIQPLKRILWTKHAICLVSIHSQTYPNDGFLASGFPIYPRTLVFFHDGHESHASFTSIPGLRSTMNCRVLRAQIPSTFQGELHRTPMGWNAHPIHPSSHHPYPLVI